MITVNCYLVNGKQFRTELSLVTNNPKFVFTSTFNVETISYALYVYVYKSSTFLSLAKISPSIFVNLILVYGPGQI